MAFRSSVYNELNLSLMYPAVMEAKITFIIMAVNSNQVSVIIIIVLAIVLRNPARKTIATEFLFINNLEIEDQRDQIFLLLFSLKKSLYY